MYLRPATKRTFVQLFIELCEIYREALHEAFDAGASTLSAVGEIVVPYRRLAAGPTLVLEYDECREVQEQAGDSCPAVDSFPPVEQSQHEHGRNEHIDE